MKTNFNFKSEICTSREQSERLLELGLKKETADCCYYYYDGEYLIAFAEDAKYPSDIPAWSLHRLLSILNEDDDVVDITVQDGRYGVHYGFDTEWYDNLYDGMIAVFEGLIKERDFNKEYLENGNC